MWNVVLCTANITSTDVLGNPIIHKIVSINVVICLSTLCTSLELLFCANDNFDPERSQENTPLPGKHVTRIVRLVNFWCSIHLSANRCPQLSAPFNGSLQPCSNLPGHTCTFSCDKGYVLVGSATRTCTDNGTWTGAETQCDGKVTTTTTLFKFI